MTTWIYLDWRTALILVAVLLAAVGVYGAAWVVARVMVGRKG